MAVSQSTYDYTIVTVTVLVTHTLMFHCFSGLITKKFSSEKGEKNFVVHKGLNVNMTANGTKYELE